MSRKKIVATDCNRIIVLLLLLLLIRVLVRIVETREEICVKLSIRIKYSDEDIQKFRYYEKTVESSEKFQNLAEAFSRSSGVSGGVDIGIQGFEIGGNTNIQDAWSKSRSSEIKADNYRSEEKDEITEFDNTSRQLFKEVTSEVKIEMKKPNRKIQASSSKYVKKDYVGSISKAICKTMDEVRLANKAKREIEAMKKGKNNTKIEGYKKDTLTEEHCYDDCKIKIIRILLDINQF